MILSELFDQKDGKYYDSSEDQSRPSLDDLRKTKLTLNAINRMRCIRDVRNFELRSNLEKVRRQFGAAPENGGL